MIRFLSFSGVTSHAEMFYRPGTQAFPANSSADGPPISGSFVFPLPARARASRSPACYSHYYEDYDHILFTIGTSDDAANWNSRVNVPSDGNSDLGGPFDLAFDSQGRSALATHVTAGNSGGVVCGDPKLSISADLQSWKTCGITATTSSTPAAPPNWPQVSTSGGPIGFQFPAPAPAQ